MLALNEAAQADRAKRVDEQFGAVFPGVVHARHTVPLAPSVTRWPMG
jgi:hypothetical protein